MSKLAITKTKIIIATIVLLVIVAGATAAVLVINHNQQLEKQAATPTKQKADDLKSKAIEAVKNKDNDTAKKLLEDAKKQYEALGDTNNAVDTEAQLYFIEHPTTPPAVPGEPATPITTETK